MTLLMKKICTSKEQSKKLIELGIEQPKKLIELGIDDNTMDLKYDIADCAAYIWQLENDIICTGNKSLKPFCADMAMKRIFLYDLCPFGFSKDYRERTLQELEEHINNGRCTESSKVNYEKLKKKKLASFN